MARRLPTIARWINENLDGYTARIERGFYNTDRKYGRVRFPGKGRHGNQLIVTDPNGDEILNHNSADPFRDNADVERWIERLLRDLGVKDV